MLDGRVLGASQVEYKPFGKLSLKRERKQCKMQRNETGLVSKRFFLCVQSGFCVAFGTGKGRPPPLCHRACTCRSGNYWPLYIVFKLSARETAFSCNLVLHFHRARVRVEELVEWARGPRHPSFQRSGG